MNSSSSWFDALALLVIALISVAAGVATDRRHVETARVLEAAASANPPQ